MNTPMNISMKIQNLLNQDLENMLKDISKDYQINFAELKLKYMQPDISNNLPKKRGRKKKTKEEFIEAEEYVYNGETYLLDNKNLIYTTNLETPTIIGEKLVDGSIKFYKP